MVTRSGQWAWTAAAGVVFLAMGPAPARAQSVNFSAGASVDPEQAYVGVAWESKDIGGRFRFRPGIDGGFGGDFRLATINVDLNFRVPLGQSGWSLVQGGGPVLSILRQDAARTGDAPAEGGATDFAAGASYLFGFAHDRGFFAEFRTGGGGYVPAFKAGAGWAVRLK